MQYEEMMKRLEEITCRLEKEQLPLAEAAKLYQEGMQLSAQCHALLDKAALAVQEMQVPAGNGGDA